MFLRNCYGKIFSVWAIVKDWKVIKRSVNCSLEWFFVQEMRGMWCYLETKIESQKKQNLGKKSKNCLVIFLVRNNIEKID